VLQPELSAVRLPRNATGETTLRRPQPLCAARLLPRLVNDESPGKRALFTALALVFALLFLSAMLAYWVPAHPGVDQNGYLVGGKMFAQHLTMGYTPPDPFCFVGRMWITTDNATFYPKYPLGLPLLYAIALWLGGPMHGVYLAHLITPLAMSLALVGTYLLLRQVLSVFPSILGVIVMAASPVTLELADNPNSHATTLCCVTWGMYFLLRWWRSPNLWWARAAGFLVGYAATIRYTEGLLVIPLLLVAAMRSRTLPNWRDAGVLLLWWFIPIGCLVTFNLAWFGHLTGYDPTRESTGFAWSYFINNWQTMLRTMYDNGLIFIFPFAIAGLVTMFWWNWQLALVLASWIVPSLLLYTAYYWAPDSPSTAYIRFFLTILPPLVLCAMWILARLATVGAGFPRPRPMSGETPPLQNIFVSGLVVSLSGAMGLYAAIPQLDNLYRSSLSSHTTGQHALASIPPGSFVFADANILHHLQFIQDYRLYSFDMFSKGSLHFMANADLDLPEPFQHDRAQALYELLKNESDRTLIKHQNFLMSLAHTLDHRVFFIGPERNIDRARHEFLANSKFNYEVVDQWTDVATPLPKSLDRTRLKRGWLADFRTPPAIPTTPWVVLEITPNGR